MYHKALELTPEVAEYWGDLALDSLEKAIELGYPWTLANADMGLGKLREMPRFEALSIREHTGK